MVEAFDAILEDSVWREELKKHFSSFLYSSVSGHATN